METKNILLLVGGIILIVLVVLLLKKPKSKVADKKNGADSTSYAANTPYYAPAIAAKLDNLFGSWNPLKPTTVPVDTTTAAGINDIKALQQAINLSNQKRGSYGVAPVNVTGILDANTIAQLTKIDAEEAGKVSGKNTITKRQTQYFIEAINDDL